MTVDEALDLVEQLLEQGRLTRVQELVFRQSWAGQSYREIAKSSGYDSGYIKDTGSRLWQMLSDALGQKVTKHNFQSALKRSQRQDESLEPKNGIGQTFPNLAVGLESMPALPKTDWGEALNVSVFYGRAAELHRLDQWIVGLARQQRSSLVAILGLGGVGKTALSVKLAQQLAAGEQDAFEYVIWRSLRNAPPLRELVQTLIQFLSDYQEVNLADTVEGQLSQLLPSLQRHRCLIVLDNFDTVLRGETDRELSQPTGRYRVGYEDYGELLQRVGEVAHQSCLVITSREKPPEIAYLEGDILPVRVLQLSGLDEAAGQQILQAKGLVGSPDETSRLVECYRGNPLALKIAATSIKDSLSGNITEFLMQGNIVFDGIRNLLSHQIKRLSALELQVMYWLAINREPISLAELQADLMPSIPQARLSAVLELLQQRSLIESSPVAKGLARFTQQPVIMEYMTDELIGQVSRAIARAEIELLNRYALVKAQSKDYVRHSQTRMILQPLIDRLISHYGGKQDVADQLNQMVLKLRQAGSPTGYLGGNVLNLLSQLQVSLTGADFSHLSIWQAHLTTTNLSQVNFAGADLSKSVFAETFGGVISVTFSPDGQQLATSDTSGEIHTWQIATGKQLVICSGHAHWTWALAFSPDGKFLASASDDYLVKLWEVETGECLKTFRGHTYSVNAIAFSPDGQQIATSSQDATIRIWDINAPVNRLQVDTDKSSLGIVDECIHILSAHESRVWSVAFSPNGEILISGSEDKTIKLWNAKTGECLQTLQGHANWIKSIAFSPDGRLFASGSFDQTVKLWDAQTGDCLSTLQAHASTVTAVAFSPDGQKLVSSSYDQTVKLWDVKTGQCIRTLHGHSNRVWSAAFSPNGQLIASGGDDHAAKLWDVETGHCIKTWKGHTNAVLDFSLNTAQSVLASGHEDQTIKLWNLKTGQILKILQGHTNRVWSVAFSPTPINLQPDSKRAKKTVLASGSADRTIKLWNWQTEQCLQTLKGHTSWVWAIAFSPNSQLLASGSYDQTVRLWEVQTGKCIRVMQGHVAPVTSVVISPDLHWLVSSGFDRTIRVWEIETGNCVYTLREHTNTVWSGAFSPDGKWFASCSYDLTIKIWDTATWQCVATLQEHTAPVIAVAFSTEGEQLASGSFDQTIKLWDVSTKTCVQTLRGHTNLVSALVFAPIQSPLSEAVTENERDAIASPLLLSGSFDEQIKLWNVKTTQCLQTLRAARPYEGMNITGAIGLTEAQKATLKALGAKDNM
jgi:WD40 repeat protein